MDAKFRFFVQVAGGCEGLGVGQHVVESLNPTARQGRLAILHNVIRRRRTVNEELIVK